jgi:polyribonucleotide nucleotidyltransferase
MIEGEYILNPSATDLEKSRLELIVAGTLDSITMVEGSSKELSEDEIINAIEFAHRAIRQIVELQNRVRQAVGRPKREYGKTVIAAELEAEVRSRAAEPLKGVCRESDKEARRTLKSAIEEQIQTELAEKYPESEGIITEIFDTIYTAKVREMVLHEGRRLDNRGYDDIRAISIEIGVLPRAHGSALFTRGQTQALATTTLGTKQDEQRVDGLGEEFFRRYMFHYSFPPYSTGETKRYMGTSRREVGHGNLAERALKAVLPGWDKFPYTIRVTSDVLESNGSSSMASVCAGLLSLMDAGVPVVKHVAGIAMGLIKEGDKTAILTDILGDEDHLGDMEFTVAGTRDGITAFQMDIKIKGLSADTMHEALGKARDARNRILDLMETALGQPRPELSPFAPRILTIHVPIDCIGMIIGPGGKMIREIVEKSGATVDIMDDGQVNIASTSGESGEKARDMIQLLIQAPEIGKIYTGTVKKIMDFGAFLEILPGKEGLLHISEMDRNRVNSVTDIMKVGDEIEVKLLSIDPRGKLDLSRRALLMAQDNPESANEPYERKRPPRPEGGSRDHGRDRDRGPRRG